MNLSSFIKEYSDSKSNRIELLNIPNRLPSIHYKYGISGKNNRNRPLLISYGQKETYISDADIKSFSNAILSTKSRYVYPLEFVKIASRYVTIKKVVFSEEHLRNLQIWANQLRELDRDLDENDFNEMNYLTYEIICKAISFANEDK